MDMHNQPTVPEDDEDITDKRAAVARRTATLPAQQGAAPSRPGVVTARPRGLSRRQLLGAGALGLAGAGVVAGSGMALAKWMQGGGLNTLIHGPLASNAQIGHLLRRAGFGASPQDIALY